MNKKMNPEVKEKWLIALTSGEYQKGKLALKVTFEESGTNWCCLGVLCDLYIKETGKGSWKKEVGRRDTFISDDSMKVSFPPQDVMEWAGIDSVSGSFLTDDGASSLVRINDETEDFSKVIAAIEEHF